MSPASTSAAELLRSIGLEVDGPARWGSTPASRGPGIFVVETPEPSDGAPIAIDEVRRWLERVPELRLDGQRPTQTVLAERLRAFWLPGQPLLYVGRTAKSLAGRVASLYATELGHARPHPGGYWLKTLRDLPRLRLWWAETDAPEEYEDELIAAFGASIPPEAQAGLPAGAPLLPWANLGSPTGPPRDTGLVAALLDVPTTTSRPSGVQRSDGSARKRAPSPTAARSPRRTQAKTAGSSAAATANRQEAPTHVTAEGLASMRAELEQLTRVERPAVIARVKAARELGDLRENADYEAARNEQSFLEGRIQQLEQRLRTAVVIEARTGGSIALGSRVAYELDGDRAELTIVGSTESDPAAGRISAVSPVGKALLGHRAGDVVEVSTPAATLSYRVIEVR